MWRLLVNRDIHTNEDAAMAAQYVDVLQIRTFKSN
jgi:3-deoxy-D-manno-octulosonic acid (KDO) 8-phosphate synthase